MQIFDTLTQIEANRNITEEKLGKMSKLKKIVAVDISMMRSHDATHKQTIILIVFI